MSANPVSLESGTESLASFAAPGYVSWTVREVAEFLGVSEKEFRTRTRFGRNSKNEPFPQPMEWTNPNGSRSRPRWKPAEVAYWLDRCRG